MATIQQLLGIGFLTTISILHGQGLDQAEVRIPYGELKQLLARAEPAVRKEVPNPALLSARLRLSLENGLPVVNATFRALSFGNDMEFIPLIGGGVSLENQDPEDAAVVIAKDSLCLAAGRAGTHTLTLRLLPVIGTHGIELSLPPCPSTIFETGNLPDGQSVVLVTKDGERALSAGQALSLPHSGGSLTARILDGWETREALRPPEPSAWTWQHQALVTPADGDLIYHLLTRASAAGGSGVEARLQMPPDARDITVSGDDLISHSQIRGEHRALHLALAWKSRGTLDRQLAISYRMPLRPLDPVWHLQAPGGEGTRTRFIIADSPWLAYAADGLSGTLTSQGLPVAIAETLAGGTCRFLEAGTAAKLTVTTLPVAATAEGVVTTAEWALKIEPDGAMLATGTMSIEHKNPLGFEFDVPDGMKLLACEVEGRPVQAVDLGGGRLMTSLPARGGTSRLTCSFTGSIAALDPVEGTMALSLPKVPLFIHSLLWSLDLPAGYQAETHGNLKRVPVTTQGPPTRIALRKNLCRDERPGIQVFYQRSDLNR